MGIKQKLMKLKLKELKEIAEKLGVEVKGKKAEVVEALLSNVEESKLKAILSEGSVGLKILEHKWVPEHRIMSEDEVRELEKRFGPRWNFPKILSTDPIVQLLGAKVGDVIEITRKSETAGEAKYYRVVVKGVQE